VFAVKKMCGYEDMQCEMVHGFAIFFKETSIIDKRIVS
jgi:transglutaminase/protease-like cytokinesis protein 3